MSKEQFILLFKTYYGDLDDLCRRLQESYNNGTEFEQYEEDRLALFALLDSFDNVENE